LTDLARHAGVSTATVSRVLNEKRGVSPRARETVFAAIDSLGYERPDRLRERPVGLVVPELSDPVFPAFAQGIEKALSSRAYAPLLCTQSPSGTTEDQYVEMLLGQAVDGIVFVSGLHADSSASPERYRRLRRANVPFVVVNGRADGIEAPAVATDDAQAIEQAVRHLVSLGHRRIGLVIGPTRLIPTQRKRDAFCSLLAGQDAADAPASHVVSTLFTVEGGQAAANDLLDSGHTAIVCTCDLMAIGALQAAQARGLRVPQDVSVVGFDDSPFAAFTDPPLTTIRQPVEAMGNAAVDALLSEIHGSPVSYAEMLFRPELVVRGSTHTAPRTGPATRERTRR